MAHDNHRALLTWLQLWFLDDGGEFAVITVDTYVLAVVVVRPCAASKLFQIFVYFIGEHCRELHLSVGANDDHRGNPFHTVGLGDVCLLESLQFADLRVFDTILFDGLLPCLNVCIHRDADELKPFLPVRLVHSYHFWCILTTIGAPRCPEVEHNGLALGPLGEQEILALWRL